MRVFVEVAVDVDPDLWVENLGVGSGVVEADVVANIRAAVANHVANLRVVRCGWCGEPAGVPDAWGTLGPLEPRPDGDWMHPGCADADDKYLASPYPRGEGDGIVAAMTRRQPLETGNRRGDPQ